MPSVSQMVAVVRLEMNKTFLARRGMWVYLLALAPVVLFVGRAIVAPRQAQRLRRLASEHPVNAKRLLSLRPNMTHDDAVQMLAGKPAPSTGEGILSGPGMNMLLRGLGFRVPPPGGRPPGMSPGPGPFSDRMTREDVVSLLGEPYNKRSFDRNNERGRFQRDFFNYTDGQSDYTIRFDDGFVREIERRDVETLSQALLIFATIFQMFYLRLAIFFGCVGIFTNLFRGEMIDKSLHYYLLTPMRREYLVVGKFLAGLMATVVIFVTSTALQISALLWAYKGVDVQTYLHNGGWAQIASYLAVTALACAAYGSIFLAAGLIFKNPILPAVLVLVWESANLFLPATLKKLSLIYYLQSLCPIPAPPDREMPQLLQTLLTASVPTGKTVALIGISLFAIAMLTIAAVGSRRLEINYSTD